MKWTVKPSEVSANILELKNEQGEILAHVTVHTQKKALISALLAYAPAGADALIFCRKLEANRHLRGCMNDELRADLRAVLAQVGEWISL